MRRFKEENWRKWWRANKKEDKNIEEIKIKRKRTKYISCSLKATGKTGCQKDFKVLKWRSSQNLQLHCCLIGKRARRWTYFFPNGQILANPIWQCVSQHIIMRVSYSGACYGESHSGGLPLMMSPWLCSPIDTSRNTLLLIHLSKAPWYQDSGNSSS